jgi:hypothetical protein
MDVREEANWGGRKSSDDGAERSEKLRDVSWPEWHLLLTDLDIGAGPAGFVGSGSSTALPPASHPPSTATCESHEPLAHRR